MYLYNKFLLPGISRKNLVLKSVIHNRKVNDTIHVQITKLQNNEGTSKNYSRSQEYETKTAFFQFEMTFTVKKKLKAFTVNNGSPSFIVFLFRDPHLLEGGKRGQD